MLLIKKLQSSVSTRGFTLIELMIVVAIISVLVGMGAASYQSAQKNARDQRRVNDLAQIKTALEFHFENNRAYPCHSICGVTWLPKSTLNDKLEPEYIRQIPLDPTTENDHGGIGGSNGCDPDKPPYAYSVNGNDNPMGASPPNSFDIFAKLENSNSNEASSPKPPPKNAWRGTTSDGYRTFTINSGLDCGGVTFNYWVSSP